MGLRLNGSTSGYTEIDAPASAGNNTLVLPTGNGTNGQYLQTNGSGTLSWSGSLTLGTAQNSTSGTNIDFTGIPSWVKRVTVMFNGVRTGGSSAYQIQLGDSGGIETSGYDSSVGSTTSTSGLLVCSNLNASTLQRGISTICLFSGNTWVSSGCVGADGGNLPQPHAGVKTLSATLDRVRITTVSGDTFNNGTINIMYEG